MSKSETTETVEEGKSESIPRKRVRHRKKQLYENILKQMEFYFSDANLSKDRFLGDLVKADPYVPLETFLNFNKLSAITQDVNAIAKAMKNSTLLELSEDHAKVRRKVPILPYDADARTVYVESIPVTATREWLQRVFSDYGNVVYISLPKFKHSQKLKGYGFIEFAKPEEAQKCLSEFTKMGCKLPSCLSPDELSSIKTFSVEKSDEKVQEEHGEPPRKKKKGKKQKNLQLKLDSDMNKRNASDIDTPTDDDKNITSVSTPTENKMLKLESDAHKRHASDIETPTDDDKSITSVCTPTEKKMMELESKDEATSHEEEKSEVEDSGTPPKKKKKVRNGSAKERNQERNSPEVAPKSLLWGLQVLAKKEWKALRNKYLNLQRKNMKEIKMKLYGYRHYTVFDPVDNVDDETVPENQEGGDAKTTAPAPLERIPGVFVKEILAEPCLDIRLTKRTIRSNVHALHVDVKEGQSEAIIRFDSPEAASAYCENSSNRAHTLTGPEEEEQWSRAELARNNKRPRGRCRLLARHQSAVAVNSANLTPASPTPTHTHIRFDEE